MARSASPPFFNGHTVTRCAVDHQLMRRWAPLGRYTARPMCRKLSGLPYCCHDSQQDDHSFAAVAASSDPMLLQTRDELMLSPCWRCR